MNIPSDINATTLEALEGLKNNGIANSQHEQFLSIMMNNGTPDTNNLFSSLYSKENSFNKAIFSAIENENFDGLKTLSLMANLNGIQMLARGAEKNNFDTLYDNYIQKEAITELEEKLETIDKNLAQTEDEKLRSAYEEEYKIYSKVLAKYKEFQAEDEKVLAQMMHLRKGSALL